MMPRIVLNPPSRSPGGRPMILLTRLVLAGTSIHRDSCWVPGEEGDVHGEVRELPDARLEDVMKESAAFGDPGGYVFERPRA